MITEDLTNRLNLPKELYPILDIKDGLVLISGAMNTGKTTMLQKLTRGFDKNKPNHGWILVNNNNPKSKIAEEEMAGVYYFPNIHTTAEECKDIPSLYDKMFHFSPDLIVAGEMRESEDAVQGFRSSITGHLIYSTIHAPDVKTAIHRYEMLLRESDPIHTWSKESIKASLKAVIHMKRDETTGLPVVGEVKIF